MYKTIETSIIQCIILTGGNVYLKANLFTIFRTWYVYVPIPKDMYLHDIPVCMQQLEIKIKILTRTDFCN